MKSALPHRRIFLTFILLAPFGWLLFWAIFHNVPGQDWVVFHTAAALFRANDAATLADPRAFTDTMNTTHTAWFPRPITVLHPWVYPPVTLVVALLFGGFSYLVSLYMFMGVTLGAMLALLWRLGRDLGERLCLVGFVVICPATAYTLGAGQLSFLIAASVLGGMALLETQPFLAGVVFSLLCLKPQFVPLIPVALLAGRQWRAVAGGAAGGVFLVAGSAAITGVSAWVDWVRLATGQNPVLGKLIDVVRVYDQSVHTAMRMLGAGEGVAGAGQLVVIAVAAACVAVAFARPLPWRQRTIVLLCALVGGAPHVGDYDHTLLAIAAVMILLDGSRLLPGEAALAAAVWIATMFNPPAMFEAIGVGWLAALSALTCFLPILLTIMETVPALWPAAPGNKSLFASFSSEKEDSVLF